MFWELCVSVSKVCQFYLCMGAGVEWDQPNPPFLFEIYICTGRQLLSKLRILVLTCQHIYAPSPSRVTTDEDLIRVVLSRAIRLGWGGR